MAQAVNSYSDLQNQRLLSMAGYRPGRLDGRWGVKSKSALDLFTAENQKPIGLSTAIDNLKRIIEDARALVPVLTAEQVQEIAPKFPARWIWALNQSLVSAHITRDRMPHFVAQLAHESDGFQAIRVRDGIEVIEEYATGEDYEGRKALGNVVAGDGRKYKGRGPIQLTGRANYRRYEDMSGIPLLRVPVLAGVPAIGFQVSALYWLDLNCNESADRGDLEGVTRLINGGLNGIDDRRRYYRRALAIQATI